MEDVTFENLHKVMEDYAKEVIEVYRQKLEAHNHNASKDLTNTLNYEIDLNNDGGTVYLIIQDYFKYLEDGTRPHKPPIEPIKRWIENKGIIPTADSNGRLPTQEQLAYAIQRAIEKNGTIKQHQYHGCNPLEETIAELQDKYIALLEDAVNQDAIRFIDVNFATIFN